MPEPDLTAELDEAEAVAAGEVTFTFRHGTKVTVNRDGNVVETEWGVRYDALSGVAAILGTGPDNERRARHEVACWPDEVTLVRRTVTYGPWEVVTDA